MDITHFNKRAWNKQVEKNNVWTQPVSPSIIAQAKDGQFSILLTPEKPVPREWFPDLNGCKVLALASAGGQQGPILAASGADVTVFDNSPAQLAQDKFVADREGLKLRLIEGDMQDLSRFKDGEFDFIFHPCSNCFVPQIKTVWQHCFRILKSKGTMVVGFVNPIVYLPDPELEKKGIVTLKYKMPYSDLDLSQEERDAYFGPDEPLNFAHTIEDQIGGQLKAGFHLIDMYDDGWSKSGSPINQYLKCYTATRALKP